MGKCNKYSGQDKNITILDVSGKTLAREIIKWLREFYDEFDSKHLLWDLLEADLSGIADEDVAVILKVSKEYSSRRPDGKTAIVIRKTDAFLAKSYDYFASIDELNLKIGIFETRQEGLDWLSE